MSNWMVYKNEDGRQCTGCKFRINRPPDESFGHTRCSIHRKCAGWRYWEPDLCEHCKNLDNRLILMDLATRGSYMGKLQLMLQKQQAKINEIGRDWDYIPIYEFKFKKYHFNLTDQNAQTQSLHIPYLNTPQDSSLTATSPFEEDMLQYKCIFIVHIYLDLANICVTQLYF